MSQPGGASRNRSRVVAVVAVCAAVVAVSAAVVALVFKGAGSSSAVGSATLEAAAVPGADPFAPSVASGVRVALKGAVIAEGAAVRRSLPADASTHARIASGTAPGLYGGSGDVHVCDPQQLVAYLNAHQDKAAAWARVLGIDPKDIGRYVATLTPVVLTGDTLVGNHGFRDGAATSLLSVLQAGTAVMVDATGTRRVKCNCGNPLTMSSGSSSQLLSRCVVVARSVSRCRASRSTSSGTASWEGVSSSSAQRRTTAMTWRRVAWVWKSA